MLNTRSVFLVSCLFFAGCKGCTEDVPASSQDATVDVVTDTPAASDAVSSDAVSDAAAAVPCHDAGLDAPEVSLVPGC